MQRLAGPTGLIARAAEWYRTLDPGGRTSVVALVVANAIPIGGVLFLDWSLIAILVLYWLENGIVGLWNIPRIALARGPAPISAVTRASGGVAVAGCSRLLLVPFFVVHYGIFWLGHGFFLAFLPALGMPTGGLGAPPDAGFEAFPGPRFAFGGIDPATLGLGVAALAVSHGISFFFNYVGRREYLRTSPQERMTAVYGRVVVLHLTIIFGSIAVAALGGPIWILVVLVIAKTILDLGFHAREHGRVAPA